MNQVIDNPSLKGLFEEELLIKECIENILANIDLNIEAAGNDRKRIVRLLEVQNNLKNQMHYYLSLTDEIVSLDIDAMLA